GMMEGIRGGIIGGRRIGIDRGLLVRGRIGGAEMRGKIGIAEIIGIVRGVTGIGIAGIEMIGITVRADAEIVMRGVTVEDLYMTGRLRREPIIVILIGAARMIGATTIRETMIAVVGPIVPTTETEEIVGILEVHAGKAKDLEEERKRKLVEMQSNANEMEDIRRQRIAEVTAMEDKQREEDDKQRSERGRFVAGLHRQLEEDSLDDRLKRSRGGLSRMEED
ncbi:RNA-splicing factor, partial [Aspergillus hancockii]